jgi:NAD-dependent protein deacetylase/lipoamidase
MRNLVVLSGAGMSAESGIKTFRDAGGLWEGHDVMEVASPLGWRKNPQKVLDFYNARRKNVNDSQPNKGHKILAELEAFINVNIITQNIDDLHERAGSTNILHLHGEINKCESSIDPEFISDVSNGEIKLGEFCPKGGQLRPHIVWFGEAVPNMEQAMQIVRHADLLLVIGTSMKVYPAAGLSLYAPEDCETWLIDPNPDHDSGGLFKRIVTGASEGMEEFKKALMKKRWF